MIGVCWYYLFLSAEAVEPDSQLSRPFDRQSGCRSGRQAVVLLAQLSVILREHVLH